MELSRPRAAFAHVPVRMLWMYVYETILNVTDRREQKRSAGRCIRRPSTG
jgi:hypothetical protein